ncbi:PLP-dependent aminotransferase family protein [Paralcaligenes ureilyticus]|uniref:GntR family transcriptional regulator n=1 Tax=Paralcaligenes ureilyticus TaxID=627131 RepID=A0A4R3LS79_9BURK|nr:PLP-dependent aminotransferase family protein [Paralcaligenes ureilyticus]TCT03372.1 GntR family transcriptional regulator [Paralcaligenes ureilyticus]
MSSFTLADWLLQRLDIGAGGPVYRQLYQLISRAILDGHLEAGTRLPSSRILAGDLAIARNTVIQVYEQLVIEGYANAASGRGTYVEDLSPDRIEGSSDKRRGDGQASAPCPRSGLSPRGQDLIDHVGFSNRQMGAFMPGIPDVAEFPFKAWLRIQNKQWRHGAAQLMSYAPAGGYEPLRHAVSEYLGSVRSVNSTARQVVITTGIHQAVDVATRLLCQIGDVVWIEEPSYWGVRNLVLSSGLKAVPISVDQEGMCPTAQELASPPKLIVVTPSHQYPLGMVMSLARRRMLLEYARQNGCWIIEDDYDSEFRFGRRPLPSLQGLDDAGLVFYAGSFSKTLFPGLRVGFLVVPDDLAMAFAGAVAELYREGQLITQSVLAEFLREGHLTSHIRRVRNLYAERRLGLIAAITRRYGDRLDIVGEHAGLHLVLALPDRVDDRRVTREAIEQGVVVRPLSNYYMKPGGEKKGLLMGYAAVPMPEIDPAFDVLAGVIDTQLDGWHPQGVPLQNS